MYNQLYDFDIDDLFALANVEFHIIKCAMCGKKVYQIDTQNWEKFQNIQTHGEIGTMMINGREKQICDKCADHPVFE